MKKIILSILLSFVLVLLVHSQNYNIASYNNQTVNTCTGDFYDSGGQSGNYLANEIYEITFCPGTAGAYIRLNFTSFQVAAGDQMEIFDGPNSASQSFGVFNNTLSPVNMIVGASVNNPSGCITVRWTSAGMSSGWHANVSCDLPCQPFEAGLFSSVPPFHLDSNIYYIDICPGDSIYVTGTGNYFSNNQFYNQKDSTSTFYWDFGNGQLDTSQNASVLYDSIRGYNIELKMTDSIGCLSTIFPEIRVKVSTKPSFDGLFVSDTTICAGDTTGLYGYCTPKHWQAESSLNLAGLTYLPDGSGASYTSNLIFNSFAPGQQLTSTSDIVSICAKMEHSYLGDLNITISCPSGQSTVLKSYPGGSSTFLGEPIDNNSLQIPGVGYNYCWQTNGSTTMIAAAGAYNYTYTNALGNSVTNTFLPPSGGYPNNATATTQTQIIDYQPEQSYANLIGCPLNGVWTITVTDNLAIDNGFIFSWGIEFDPGVLPVSWGYTPSFTSQTWNNSPTVVDSNGNHITIKPDSSGIYNYTFTVNDDLGCTYDTSATVYVSQTPSVDLGNDTAICDDNFFEIDAGNSIPGQTWLWNTGNTTQYQLASYTYDFIATVSYADSLNTCIDSDTVHIDIAIKPEVDLGPDTCYQESSIVLDAENSGNTPPSIYVWSNGSDQQIINVSETGKYSVIVASDSNLNCYDEDTVAITFLNENFLGEDLKYCDFETKEVGINLHSDINYNYTWLLDGNEVNASNWYKISNLAAGVHNLKLLINGCEDEIILEPFNCELTIPNVITPNNDSRNDVFKIVGIENFPNSVLVIYNRWGKKVFESNSYHNEWDGENNSDGVYYYVLTVRYANQEKMYNGSITVIRK